MLDTTKAAGRRGRHLPMLMAAWFGAIDGYLYVTLVMQAHLDWSLGLHNQIVDDTATSPYRYRILIPYVTDSASHVLGLAQAYGLFYLAIFPLALCSLLALLRRWYPTSLALLGTTVVAAVLPLTFRDHYFQPATWLELVLMIAALRLLMQPVINLRWYAVVSILAATNRETGVLFGLLLILVAWPIDIDRRRVTALVAVAPAVTYGLIHLARGSAPPAEHDLLARNITDLPIAVVQVGLFITVFALLAVSARHHAPRIFRRAAWIIVAYVPLIGTFGIWREVRLLVPLLPILLGIGLTELRHLDDFDPPITTHPQRPLPMLRTSEPSGAKAPIM